MGKGITLNLVNLVSDLVGLIPGAKGAATAMAFSGAGMLGNNQNHQYARSIRGRADKFVMQFPVVISDSVSVDTAEIVRNQIELERAVNLKLVLDNTPVFDYDPMGGFLYQIHNNININEDDEQEYISAPKSELDKINKEQLVKDNELIEESVLNDYTLPRAFMESDAMQRVKNGYYKLLGEDIITKRKLIEERNKEKAERQQDEVKEPKKRYEGNTKANIDLDSAKQLNNSIPIFINTTVNFALRPYNPDGTVDYESTDIKYSEKPVSFGVKAVQHVAQSEDISFFLADASKRSNFFARLVNFTTGEVNIVKRLFGIDKYRHAAEAYKRTRQNTWKNLLRLGDTENFRRYSNRFGKNIRDGIIPTTTLVISSAEEEMIFKKTGYRISQDARFASTVYRDLYLQELMVVDEANETITRYSDEAGFDRLRINSLSGGRLSDSNKKSGDGDALEKLLRRNL